MRASSVASAIAGCLLSGCLATTQEIEDLRVDINRLRGQLDQTAGKQTEFLESLQGNQADLMAQMTALSSRLEALGARLEENDSRMSALAVRLDDLDKNFSGRLDNLSEGVGSAKKAAAVAPSKLFQLAYGDYMKRRYSQALKGFQDYATVYPDAAQAAEAQFYVGECRFALKDWKGALEAYDAVIVSHAVSPIVPSAILQKAATLEKRGEAAAALPIYEALVKKFPEKPEAEAARARIEALRRAAAPPPDEVVVPEPPAKKKPEAAAPAPAKSAAPAAPAKKKTPRTKPLD